MQSQVLKMSNLDPENRNDPLNDVFPKVKVWKTLKQNQSNCHNFHTTHVSRLRNAVSASTVHRAQWRDTTASVSFRSTSSMKRFLHYVEMVIVITIICHSLQKWLVTNYHYDDGCLKSWCWCQRSIILLSHIIDHQATTATDLHPSLVLVCFLDCGVWTQLGLEGECSVKAVIISKMFLYFIYILR